LLKIFTTQLTGVFKKIAEDEFVIEEASRILAQTILSEGTIYFHGTKEFEAISREAVEGEERLQNTKSLKEINNYEELGQQDCVVIATRYSSDEEAIAISKKLQAKEIKLIGISSNNIEYDSFSKLVDVHIDLKKIDRLVPLTDGKRIGYPIIMAGLFAYFGLYLTTTEILFEFENDEL
jgi:hypothetical protein